MYTKEFILECVVDAYHEALEAVSKSKLNEDEFYIVSIGIDELAYRILQGSADIKGVK